MSDPAWKIMLRRRAAKSVRKRQLGAMSSGLAAKSAADIDVTTGEPAEPASLPALQEPESEAAVTVARPALAPRAAAEQPPGPVEEPPAPRAAPPVEEPPPPAQAPRAPVEEPPAPVEEPPAPVEEPVEPPPAVVARTAEAAPAKASLEARLLDLMDRKHHPSWVHLTQPGLTSAQLFTHFRHEYLTYVRDFPVLLARVLAQGPPADVRAALAANLYEEQTGGLSFGVSHPDLFLEMMDGLGLDRAAIAAPTPDLAPAAVAYRALLDRLSASAPWVVGAAVLAIFVEGSVHERAELSGTRAMPPVEAALAAHPMVAHYGCPPGRMRLLRAHRAVESGHRKDAWRIVTEHAGRDDDHTEAVVAAVAEARLAWYAYREAVALAMGVA